MKIGIITWYKYENYGTKLQALALQHYLKKIGYDVELLDFEIKENIVKDNRTLKQKLIDKYWYLTYKINLIIYKKQYKKKQKALIDIINNNCNFSPKINNEKDFIEVCNSYDVLICGSDQIWNPNWYHPYYYANYKEIKTKLVSYAPSFGIHNISTNFKNINELKNALNKFFKISVREKDGQDIIKSLINKKVEIVVDPTLLLDNTEWSKFEAKNIENEKYVLCYLLSNNKRHLTAIKKFAKEKNMKLLVIPHVGLTSKILKNNKRDAGVEEFLTLIKNAEYVMTDSFHGTIFSMIYNKEFYLFARHNPDSTKSQNSRLLNLLNITHLQNRMIEYNVKKINEIDLIDYKVVNKLLDEIVNKSKQFLKKAIIEEE